MVLVLAAAWSAERAPSKAQICAQKRVSARPLRAAGSRWGGRVLAKNRGSRVRPSISRDRVGRDRLQRRGTRQENLRAYRELASESLIYDAQDRIISYGDFEYEFTDNGELATKTDIVTNEVTSYSYDALGNLRGVTLPNGDVIEHLVDGRGRRVGKKMNGVLVKQWLWRGQLQPVAELDGAGNVVARFVYAGGVNVPVLVVTSTATYRIVTDHLGSVRSVIDASSGAAAQEISYDAWGRVLGDSSPGLQPFGFAGGLIDQQTGLVRFGARNFDAEIGRWTSKDPLRFDGGLNLFVYANNDPNTYVDPNGNLAWVAGALLVGEVIVVAAVVTAAVAGVVYGGTRLGQEARDLYDAPTMADLMRDVGQSWTAPIDDGVCDIDEDWTEPTNDNVDCYKIYLVQTADCGQLYTSDETYDLCMFNARQNYVRCLNGVPPEPLVPWGKLR